MFYYLNGTVAVIENCLAVIDCGGVRYSPHGECIRDIVASGKYPEIPDIHACNNVVGPGAIGFNAGHIWDVDNTDPCSVSRGLVKGRKIAKAFRDALAEFCPSAFANGHLVKTAVIDENHADYPS